jgi:two-component system OmpR family response regulator
MENSGHILVVDDDPEIRELLAHFLSQHGYSTATAADGAAMDAALSQQRPDLVVLDLMLPGEDGLSLCRRLRADSSLPIIMLTAVSDDADRIVGLEMGADDYLVKPFNPRELLARIKAVLRRSGGESAGSSGTVLAFEGWQLDLGRRELKREDGTLVPLSTGEFELLAVLAEHPQQVMSRDELMDRTRGRENGPFDRSIDVQLSRLRRKIEQDPKSPQVIKTIRSEGYMFSLPVLPLKESRL